MSASLHANTTSYSASGAKFTARYIFLFATPIASIFLPSLCCKVYACLKSMSRRDAKELRRKARATSVFFTFNLYTTIVQVRTRLRGVLTKP
jgi:hypothetical protein